MNSQADHWERLFDDVTAHEEAAKESLERRATDVLRGVSAIVTILVAVSALVYATEESGFEWYEIVVLVIALVLFGSAGIIALLVLNPRTYRTTDLADLRKLVEGKDAHSKFWMESDPTVAQLRIAELQLNIVEATRKANQAKATLLQRATWSAFGGVAALGTVLVLALV